MWKWGIPRLATSRPHEFLSARSELFIGREEAKRATDEGLFWKSMQFHTTSTQATWQKGTWIGSLSNDDGDGNENGKKKKKKKIG